MRRFALLLAMLAAPVAAQTAGEKVYRLAELVPSGPSLEITRAETLPELAKLGFEFLGRGRLNYRQSHA